MRPRSPSPWPWLAAALPALLLAACAAPRSLEPDRVYEWHRSEPVAREDARGGVLESVELRCDGPSRLERLERVRLVVRDVTLYGDLSRSGAPPREVIRLPRLRRIQGNLVIRPGGARAVELPALEVVEGHVEIAGGASLERIELPRLREIGGDLDVANNGALTALDLPRLRQVGGGVALGHCDRCGQYDVAHGQAVWHMPCQVEAPDARLAAVRLPALETIGRGLAIRGEPALEAVELPALRAVRFVDVSRNAALRSLGLPRVERTSDLVVAENPALVELDLTRLETVEWVRRVEVGAFTRR